jgi:signal transduction histidine kinase
MSQIFVQTFTLLTTPPGNLIYHLVLAFSLAGALQGAVNLWRSNESPQARRMIFGLSVLLGLQLILFGISGLVWQKVLTSQTALPPLDRAITLLSLIWMAWLWAFPEPVRKVDAATLLLNLLAIALLGVTFISWSQSSNAASFNLSNLEIIWQVFSLVFIILGAVAMILRSPNGWAYGLAMLGLAFLGHLIQLFWPQPAGNLPGVVRLTQIAMYPILLTLPQRFTAPVQTVTVQSDQKAVERRRYSIDQKTFQALVKLASEVNPDNLGHAITRSVAQAMLADLCFLIALTDDKNVVITYGFDLIREENLAGTAINKMAIPLLANAIQRGRPLRLPASSTSADLKNLGLMLGLTSPGHLMSVPVLSSERKPIGAILLLSPYSNRQWSSEDQTFLFNVSASFAPIIERTRRTSAVDREHDHLQQAIQDAQEEAVEAKNKYAELLEQVENARPQNQYEAENLAALLTAQEEAQQTIAHLRAENEQLHKSAKATGIPTQTKQLEHELRLSLEEVARLQNSLADAKIRLHELESLPNSPISNEQVQVLASISQELRQPMSSIVGYTDLILGESVGILGNMQRKFLERIKTASQRLGALVDDLIQITTLEIARIEIKPELIDLNLIVDNAMAYTSSQLREKNITLRLDVPETSPHLQTDREALQQIIIHLLQNASLASLVEGTVTLRVQLQNEGKQDYLLIRVTDTGGGIQPKDIPHVFQRRYRADNVLIQGLGDTGVGLSICKSLVEAQNGRLWVETTQGVGSTFSALLPVARPASAARDK